MARMVIGGADYPVPDEFTYRELGIIKRIAGVRAGELMAALIAGDTDIVVALAIIVMRRAGKRVDEDALLDGELGSIELHSDDEGDENDPPDAVADGDGSDET